MDLRGKTNIFGGASHSSDLPLLLGPSLFQQISRRRFNSEEDRICRQMKSTFASFIKTGQPSLGSVYSIWHPYSSEYKFIFNIGDSSEHTAGPYEFSTTFEQNLPEIERLLSREKIGPYRTDRHESNSHNRRTKASLGFTVNQRDSIYYLHLKDVYAFWNVMLPNMDTNSGIDKESINEVLSQHGRFIEASTDAIRYKRAFFLLLVLVCFLLAILSICVYLLQRDPMSTVQRSNSSTFSHL